MGLDCMGRVGYGPSLSWAEFVMGRVVQLPLARVTNRNEHHARLSSTRQVIIMTSA